MRPAAERRSRWPAAAALLAAALSSLSLPCSAGPASGTKLLYVYDNQSMSRTPQASNTATPVSISQGATADWTLGAVKQTLVLTPGGNINVSLVCQDVIGIVVLASYSLTAQLLKNGSTVIGTSGSIASSTTLGLCNTSFTIPTGAAGTLAAGDTLVLRVKNTSTSLVGAITLNISQKAAGTGSSSVSFPTSTVINVDSVLEYSAAYSSSATQAIWEPNATVYIRAVVSDPFGSYDVNGAKLVLTDPAATVQVNGAAMTQVADSGAATKTYEYAYAVPNTAVEGIWTPSVTAAEGTEGTIIHTAAGNFELRRPSLMVLKSVSILSDPLGDAKPRAIPGAIAQYAIVVSNTGKGRANGLTMVDAIPVNSSFVVGSCTFTDGATTSGLGAPAFSYDNGSCAGSFSYTPAGAVDPNVKCVKAAFVPTAFMNGQTGASAPSFTLTFQTQVN